MGDPRGRVFFAEGREKEETFAKLGNWKKSLSKLKFRSNILIYLKFYFGVFFSIFNLYLVSYLFYVNLVV